MPKVYLTAAQREAAQAQSGDDALRIVVATRMMRDGLKQADIAQRIGIQPADEKSIAVDPG